MASMTVFGAVAVAAPARVRAQWPARSPMQARPARVGRSAGRVSLVPRAAKKSAPKAPVEQPAEAAPVEAPTTPPPATPPLPRATFLLVRPPSAARFRTHRHDRDATRPDAACPPRRPSLLDADPPLSAPPPRIPLPMPPTAGASGQYQQYQGYPPRATPPTRLPSPPPSAPGM